MKILYSTLFTLVCILATFGNLNAQQQLVTDGGFEGGPGASNWITSSTNFPSPICDLGNCGAGASGSGPHAGNYWIWFGGIAGTTETGTASQSFIIPVGGTVTLTFWLEQYVCDSPQDFMEVSIDGTVIFSTDGGSTLCGNLGYSLQTVDISTYADGNSHTLEFTSTTFAANGFESDFFVDDISVISSVGGTGSVCTDTTTFSALNVAIPDDDVNGINDAHTISGISGTLGVDVQLKSICFKIDHTWVGDLIVGVLAPNGTFITLTDRPGYPAISNGCAGENLDVCVTTGIGNEMENICGTLPAISGTYTAANGIDLSDINDAGGSPNGTWKLFASDNSAFDTGSIIEWSIVFDIGPVANWTSPGAICAGSGTINLNTLVNGTPGGTWSGTGVVGTGNTFDPTGLSGPIAITYMVSDTVTGCSGSETNIITVDPATPVANFNFTTYSLSVLFSAISTNATTYLWNFGDLTNSSIPNPYHTYSAPGMYQVSLTVTNSCGTNMSINTVTVENCPDTIVDGSFEAGAGSGNWTEYSLNLATPICDTINCGSDNTGPHSGNNWAWFGGIVAYEEASLSQDIMLASNSTANLTFWLEMAECDSPDDVLKIAVDADTVFSINGGGNLCGIVGYSLQAINLDAYCDGLQHTIKFVSRTYGTNGNPSNFFVDDISVNVCPGIGFAENSLDQQISIVPVPATEFISINFNDIIANDVQIEIYNMIGKIVDKHSISRVNVGYTKTIDVSDYSKGVYIVKIANEVNSTVRKIIIQ